MNRREFSLLLTSGAVAVAAVSSLTPEVEAEVVEFHSTKQYIVRFKDLMPIDKCLEMEMWLRRKGLNCVVVSGELDLLEVK